MRVLRPFMFSSSMARALSSSGLRVALGVALFAGFVAFTWLVTGTEVHVAAPMPSF